MRLSLLALFGLALYSFAADDIITAPPLQPKDSVPSDTLLRDTAFAEGITFRAQRVDLATALSLFAQANGLKLRADTTLSGKVDVDFANKNLPDALAIILGKRQLSWRLEGDLLVVSGSGSDAMLADQPITDNLQISKGIGYRMFRIDYPRLKRSGSGSSAASISGTASGEAGSVQLSTTDELEFWLEIEGQVKAMLSVEGVLVINRTAGVLYVTDVQQKLDVIEHYLDLVVPAMTRQVEITARIYEVTLNDDRSLGVDWNRIDFTVDGAPQGRSLQGGVLSDVIDNSPSYKARTFQFDLATDNARMSMVVAALKEQGNVQAVSQPRVVTLNNQPALVKVGTDYPYFSVTKSINDGVEEIQEQVTIITVGVVLSVTPQVSDDGWITLGIDPLISDLVTTARSTYGSTAPVIDVKQSSSLVRLKNRETVRISGLLHSKESEFSRKVPLLGDIPLLGALFRWTYTKKERKELVIFITPRVL